MAAHELQLGALRAVHGDEGPAPEPAPLARPDSAGA